MNQALLFIEVYVRRGPRKLSVQNLRPSETFLDCKIWISSECWTNTYITKVTNETRFSKGFTTFNGWSGSLNTFFDPHLWIVTLYAIHSSQISPLNTLKSFTISHIIISLSPPLSCTTTCFHSWPFIQ